jgi:hypothetical protein
VTRAGPLPRSVCHHIQRGPAHRQPHQGRSRQLVDHPRRGRLPRGRGARSRCPDRLAFGTRDYVGSTRGRDGARVPRGERRDPEIRRDHTCGRDQDLIGCGSRVCASHPRTGRTSEDHVGVAQRLADRPSSPVPSSDSRRASATRFLTGSRSPPTTTMTPIEPQISCSASSWHHDRTRLWVSDITGPSVPAKCVEGHVHGPRAIGPPRANPRGEHHQVTRSS